MKILKERDSDQAKLQKVSELLNSGELNQAKEILDSIARKDIDNMEVQFFYGVYYTKKENYRAAITYLVKVLDSVNATIYMPQAVKILVFCYIKTENYQVALSLAKDALEKYYQDVHLMNMIAYIYFEQGSYTEAVKYYRDVLKIDPNNVTALNGLGYCLIENFSRYQDGLQFCLKALTLSPYNPAILDSVGWGYYKLGKYKEAEQYLKQAFEILPENPIIKKHITLAVEAG